MKRLFNFRPVVAILSSLVAGICVFLTYSEAYYVLAAIILSLPVICFFVYAFITKKFGYKLVVFALVCQLVLIAGFFSVYLRFDSSFYSGAEVSSVTGRFIESKTSGNFVTCYFDECSFVFNGKEVSSAELSVKFSKEEDSDTAALQSAEFGNVYSFTADLVAVKKNLAGGKLNVRAYLGDEFFEATSSFSDILKKDSHVSFTEKIRLKAREVLFSGMGRDEASLTYAMLFGDSSEIDKGLLDNIRLSGVAHIFAVSGLHIGIVSGAVLYLTKKLGAKKFVSCGISLAVCFLYCAVCGYTSSSLRAFLMFAVWNVVKLSGRKNDLLNSVSFSAIVLLAFEPKVLFSAGFLLSYGAVYGICLLTPSLKRIFEFLPETARDAVSASLAAQIGSTPASVCFFGNVPLIALLLNLIVLPVISVLFILDIVAVCLGAITSLSEIFMFLPDKITSFFVAFMKGIDFSAFSVNGYLNWFVFPLCLAGIALASDKCNLGYKTKTVLFTVCFGLSMIASQIASVAGI